MNDKNRHTPGNSREFDQLVSKIGHPGCEFFPPSIEKAGITGGESPERSTPEDDPARSG